MGIAVAVGIGVFVGVGVGSKVGVSDPQLTANSSVATAQMRTNRSLNDNFLAPKIHLLILCFVAELRQHSQRIVGH